MESGQAGKTAQSFHTEILFQGNPAVYVRPVAFRPRLATSLALSLVWHPYCNKIKINSAL